MFHVCFALGDKGVDTDTSATHTHTYTNTCSLEQEPVSAVQGRCALCHHVVRARWICAACLNLTDQSIHASALMPEHLGAF